MKLCNSINISFETVSADTLTHCAEQFNNESASSFHRVSFTHKIEQLKAENSRLTDKLNHWCNKTIEESELRENAEKKTNKLKSVLKTAQTDIQQMQQNINSQTQMLNYFKAYILNSHQIMKKIKLKLKLFFSDWQSSENSTI